jgi:alpha-1,3-rhamnosyl/mannosyltransferase
MRVVMNGLAALKPKTGVGHYVARLHAALGDDVTLYPGPLLAAAARRAQRFVGGGGPGGPGSLVGRAVGLGLATAKHAAKTAAAVHFARGCRAAGYALYHEPNFIPFPADLPTVVTVHDLSVLLHPEWHPADRVRHHDRHFAPAVRRAAHVIVVSESVRRELVEFVGVPPAKVTAVHNGVGEEFVPLAPDAADAIRRRLGLPPRFLLCVGTVEPRKNILTVLRAFADLPAATRERCQLVLAGPWGWKSDPERAFFESTARHLGARHLGYVSDADLHGLYATATALLFPSRYEGFGLPVAEMLACGGAVVGAASAAAVREVAGRHAAYVDPDDVAGWRDAMRRLADEPGYAGMLAEGGRRGARAFTWERTAAETRAVYRRVLGVAAPVRRAA